MFVFVATKLCANFLGVILKVNNTSKTPEIMRLKIADWNKKNNYMSTNICLDSPFQTQATEFNIFHQTVKSGVCLAMA